MRFDNDVILIYLVVEIKIVVESSSTPVESSQISRTPDQIEEEKKKILTQVEYYFGDKNLPNDRFLNDVRSMNPQGCKFIFIDYEWHIVYLFVLPYNNIHWSFVFNLLNRDSIENDLQVQENASLQRLWLGHKCIAGVTKLAWGWRERRECQTKDSRHDRNPSTRQRISNLEIDLCGKWSYLFLLLPHRTNFHLTFE